jgi:hypothetical protein
MKILKVKLNGGSTWIKKQKEKYQKEGIAYEVDYTQKVDTIFVLESEDCDLFGNYPQYQIAIETKGSDWYKSNYAKGTNTSLKEELVKQYLGKFDDVWILIANELNTDSLHKMKDVCINGLEKISKGKFTIEEFQAKVDLFRDGIKNIFEFARRELYNLRSVETSYQIGFEYHVPILICESQESACKAMIDYAKTWSPTINLNKARYHNFSNRDSRRDAMLDQVMSENALDKLKEYLDQNEKTISNRDLFNHLDEFLLKIGEPNYARLFKDLWLENKEYETNTKKILKEQAKEVK